MNDAAKKNPFRVTFHVTDRCRYACKFCFVPPVRGSAELPAAVWVKAARDLARRRPGVEILLTGGEPILFEGVFEIAQATASAGAVVHFNSAGAGIGPREARRIGEAGVRHFNLSLDGGPETHNRLRGSDDAYRLAVETLDNLYGNAPGVRRNVVTVLMGANLEAAPAFLDGLDSDDRIQGIYLQLISNPRGPNGGEDWLADPDLWHPERATRLRVMDGILARKTVGSKILNPLPALMRMRALLDDPRATSDGECDVPGFGFFIDPRGDVSMCGLFPPAGNIAAQSVDEILDGPAMTQTDGDMFRCRIACHRRVNCASARI